MKNRFRLKWMLFVAGLASVALGGYGYNNYQEWSRIRQQEEKQAAQRKLLQEHYESNPRSSLSGQITSWWDTVPASIRERSSNGGKSSNIHPDDYSGPSACKKCHEKNYEAWSRHPHRWMNALADTSTVKGDFTGKTGMSYLGGEASFFKKAGEYRMRLLRDGVERVYQINQTIGSRFYQYYVGQQVDGPETRDDQFYKGDHVLPFGFWLDEREWVPVVHVSSEFPDGRRADPFDPTPKDFIPYASNCGHCHTTSPLGDNLSRVVHRMSRHSPYRLHWSSFAYLSETRPHLSGMKQHSADFSDDEIKEFIDGPVRNMDASQHAVNLGISCEACHLGAKAHAEGKQLRPQFLPSSPHLFLETAGGQVGKGRTQANLNWACARCHNGDRPQFAAGMGDVEFDRIHRRGTR